MAQHIVAITEAVKNSLIDSYSEVRLHGGRAVDFLGLAMDRYFGEHEEAVVDGVHFWLVLLKRPLVRLLQDDENVALRVVGCDCLGSIGPRVFERLPVSICVESTVLVYFSVCKIQNNVFLARFSGKQTNPDRDSVVWLCPRRGKHCARCCSSRPRYLRSLPQFT